MKAGMGTFRVRNRDVMFWKNGFPPQHSVFSAMRARGTYQRSLHLTALLTRRVRGAVELSGWAALFRPIHEVGWLVHVLRKPQSGVKGGLLGISDV